MDINRLDIDQVLTQMRQRLDAATPGPWEAGERCIFAQDGTAIVSDEIVDGAGAGVTSGANAEFIAAARTEYEALLGMIESLRKLHAPQSTGVEIEGAREPDYCPHCALYAPCDTMNVVDDTLRQIRRTYEQLKES